MGKGDDFKDMCRLPTLKVGTGAATRGYIFPRMHGFLRFRHGGQRYCVV